MISQQTARDIWVAYDEIEKSEKLIAEMEKQLSEGNDPNPRDSWGNRRNLQMSVPSGEESHRLYDVRPALAIAVMKAHVAEKKAALTIANVRARLELSPTPQESSNGKAPE